MTPLLLLLAWAAQPEPGALEKIEREVAAVAAKARQSVVGVNVSFAAEFERSRVTESIRLSGVVFSADGHIVCDGTAVERASDIKVTLPDGREIRARLVGLDKRTSVAVLKVEADKLTPAEFADAKEVRQGIYAIVIGNKLGLEKSVEVGFISGLGRSIQAGGRRYMDMLQMTTSVNPGDCGGYVANSRGQFIALVHSAYQGEIQDIESLGVLRLFGKDYADLLPGAATTMSFATPGATVKFVAERIVKHGRMRRGWAGMTVRPLDEATREQLGVPAGEGGEVWSVDPDGPAAKVLKRRDVILSIDGKVLTDLRAVRQWIMEQEEPRKVRVVFLRAGQKKEADLQIVIEGENK
jgi:S1-C subfamily serine protease